MTKLKDKTVLLTGAASGIGRLMALKLAAKGARLVLWDINQKALAELAQTIASQGHQVNTYLCDVSDKRAIFDTARQVQAEVGPIDVVINNAGVVYGKSFLEYTDEQLEKTIAVDQMAIVWTLRAFLPAMIERNAGHIVTISSAAGTIGVARLSAYCMAKFAAFGLDEALRMEFRKAGQNIKTTVVCPYYIDTGMFAGVKTRFAMLLPILKAAKVANKIIRAIERDKPRVILPAMVFTVPLLRLLPVKWFDWLTNFFGINASMDEFIGRNFNREDFMLTNQPQPELKNTHTECRHPATGEILGYSRLTTPAELEAIIATARQAQGQWGALPVKKRIKYLRRVRDYLAAHADEIATIISQDNGKVRVDAMATEVLPATMAISYYMRKAKIFLKPVKCGTGNLMLANKRSQIVRQPFGVIGIISPWNYPFAIPFSEVVMALLAGNSVVLKTASETQMVGRILEQCFLAAELPKGVFNYINMPGKIAGEALLSAGIDKLFFTGSVAVGKELMALAAKTLTPVVLELGGNDPMIVCEDADLERAVGGAIWAGFSNCGQSCGGVERIYVAAKVYEPFLELLKERIANLRVGLDLDFDKDMGIMTTAKQVATVQRHIEEALSKGARIYAQSPIPPTKNWQNFLPATVLVDVNHDMLVMRDETFGPVVGVMPFNTIEEAIALANDSYLGLTASVWSRNHRQAKWIAQQLQAGAVTINDHLMSHGLAETPWGGFKQSGIGRTHGKLGFDEMTQPQVIVNDIMPFVKKNMWWQPYSQKLYQGLSGLVTFLYGKGCWQRLVGLLRTLRIFPRYFTK
jgi:succinate-semialdehyde dehydrogenase/glutarate-semialdehyde dehydrogenase